MKPLDYLYALELHGIKLGLENIERLLAAADNPHLAYPTIHVAGTNGKGSVVAMLDATLRAAGYRTGRFTSPHLISVRERFVVNGKKIATSEFDETIDSFRRIAERANITPTFFEMCTAVAFQHFANHGVDVALVEVGMGGRFDSTNVVQPVATAITNIGLEHTKYLGDTLAKIAFEKAGILKPGVPVVVGERQPEALDVILARADAVGAPVRLLGRDFSFIHDADDFTFTSEELHLQGVHLALGGDYQGPNAAMAVALAESVSSRFHRLTSDAIRRGLEAARWPCRLETVLTNPTVIVDVAHNAAGAEVLAHALPDRCILILAVANDKDAGSIVRSLHTKAEHLLLTQFDGKRSLTAADLSERAQGIPHTTVADIPTALEQGIALARSKAIPLVIAGSLFTAGEARHILIRDYGAPPLRF